MLLLLLLIRSNINIQGVSVGVVFLLASAWFSHGFLTSHACDQRFLIVNLQRYMTVRVCYIYCHCAYRLFKAE